jgi:hypothetical protein
MVAKNSFPMDCLRQRFLKSKSSADNAPAGAHVGVCSECGNAFAGQRYTREFCSGSCRRAFNNRRAARGAAIYDVAMTWRSDRDAEALSLLCRMLTQFKEADDRDRAGRKSYNSIRRVKAANPYLSSKIVGRNLAGLSKRGGE